MLTRRQSTKYQFFLSQDKTGCKTGYESFPVIAEIKGNQLIIDDHDSPDENDLKELSDVATEIKKLYTLLDNRHHDFTLAAFVLEKLFMMLHFAAYGDYLHKRNFVFEIERLARPLEVTYVPQKALSKGGMFELKPVAGFIDSSSTLPPVSSSSEPYRYGQ